MCVCVSVCERVCVCCDEWPQWLWVQTLTEQNRWDDSEAEALSWLSSLQPPAQSKYYRWKSMMERSPLCLSQTLTWKKVWRPRPWGGIFFFLWKDCERQRSSPWCLFFHEFLFPFTFILILPQIISWQLQCSWLQSDTVNQRWNEWWRFWFQCMLFIFRKYQQQNCTLLSFAQHSDMMCHLYSFSEGSEQTVRRNTLHAHTLKVLNIEQRNFWNGMAGHHELSVQHLQGGNCCVLTHCQPMGKGLCERFVCSKPQDQTHIRSPQSSTVSNLRMNPATDMWCCSQ